MGHNRLQRRVRVTIGVTVPYLWRQKVFVTAAISLEVPEGNRLWKLRPCSL